jgi:hypothetical protein
VNDIEDVTNNTGRFLRIMADESHGIDRHCKCGRVLLSPWSLSCEVCEPEMLPMFLKAQAA